MKVNVVEATSAADKAANEEFRGEHVEEGDRVLYGEESDLDWSAERYVLIARDAKTSGMGAILGSATAWHIGGVAKITDLLVSPAARRKGIAQAIVEVFETRARESGCHRLHAVTVAGSGAEAFWKAMGWKVSAKLDDHYFHRDHVVMTKSLAPAK